MTILKMYLRRLMGWTGDDADRVGHKTEMNRLREEAREMERAALRPKNASVDLKDVAPGNRRR
jgi:hypothetical protein